MDGNRQRCAGGGSLLSIQSVQSVHPGGNYSGLRGVARGSGQSGDGGQGFITEGDLSGGGGQPASAPSGIRHRGAAELVAEHLRQVQESLAVQHEGVLRLVDQLLGDAPHTPVAPVTPGGTAAPAQTPPRLNWEVSGPFAQPALDLSPMRPADKPVHQVPVPDTDAPRMVMPGELETEGEAFDPEIASARAEEAQEPRPETPTSKTTFVLHDVFHTLHKERRNLKRANANPMVSAVAMSRITQATFIAEGMSQLNVSTGLLARFIIHPNSIVRGFWDVMSMLLVLYDLVMVPFGFFEPELTIGMHIMNWTTRLFWTGDIPISFASGYVTADGTIELRPKHIALKYAKSWLLLDLVVVGSDWTEIILGEAMAGMDMARMSKITRIFRILRMIRLLRLAKVGEIVSLIAERLPSEKLVVFIDILKLIVIMLGIGHLLACVWYVIGKDLGPQDRVDWNWLDRYEFTQEDLKYKYIMSMRWALSQFAGGMDEVTPVSLAEHIYAGFVYIFAFWSGTVFLSILTSHFTQLYILGNQQSQQLNIVRRYLAHHGISKGLVLRVTRNAQHTMKVRQRATPEAAVGLLELVSEPLRIELHYEMYYPMLSLHPFFADYMKACPFVVRKICHGAMSTCTYSKDDTIFHFGEAASKMLMVRSGVLKYTWGNNVDETLSEGRWVSEPPLWTHWAHRGVLTASEDAVVFSIDAKSFQNIISLFEIAEFDPSEYASKYVRALNRVPADDLNDLPVKAPEGRRRPWGSMVSGKTLRRQFTNVSLWGSEKSNEEVEELDDDLFSNHSGEGKADPTLEAWEDVAKKNAKANRATTALPAEHRARSLNASQVVKSQRSHATHHAGTTNRSPKPVPGVLRTTAVPVRSHLERPTTAASSQLAGRPPSAAAGARSAPARALHPALEPLCEGSHVHMAPQAPAPAEDRKKTSLQERTSHMRMQLEQLEDLCKEEEV